MKAGKIKTVFPVAMVLLFLFAVPAMAQQVNVNPSEIYRLFNIEAGSLEEALDEYSKTTGTKTIYLNKLVTGKKNPGIQGRYSAEAALAKILEGTGLTYRFTDQDTVVLKEGKTVAVQNTLKGEKSPNLEKTDDSGVPLGTLTVRGRRMEGYGRSTATSALKLDIPLIKTPATVNILSGEILEDRGVNRFSDALRTVSNVQVNGGYDEAYFIRGFFADQNLRNGMVYQPSLAEPTMLADVENVERVEVLKGPSSVLYGQIEPGGVVNYVTKQPLESFFASTQIDVGTFDLFRAVADVTGPVNDSGTLLMRLNAAYQQNHKDRDFVEQKRYMIAPSLTWQISNSTSLNMNAEYISRDETTDFGFPLNYGDPNGEVYLQLPRERFLGEPDDKTETDQFVTQAFLNHELSSAWSVDLRLQYTYYDQFNEGISFIVEDFANPEREVFRTFADPYERNTSTYQGQINLTGRFATGPFDHTALLGTEYRQGTIEIRGRVGIAANLDIFDPKYGQPIQVPAEPLSFSNIDDDAETLAFYFQDLIEFGEQWNLLLGGRLDHIQQERRFVAGSREGEVVSQEETVFSPRVGLVFQPTPETSLYASYSESFRPSLNGTRADTFTRQDGSLLPITESSQVEIGAKANILEEHLWGTIALFNIVKENVAVRDPDASPFSDFRIPVGEQRSRGVELELRGQPTKHIEFTSFYAYTDAEVTEDTRIPVGSRLRFTPEHSVGFWGLYRFLSGPLVGLKLGAGFNYYSETEASLPNVVTIDPYTLVDASIIYERSGWRAGLFFKNILNELYFAGGVPQDGFSVIASIGYRF